MTSAFSLPKLVLFDYEIKYWKGRKNKKSTRVSLQVAVQSDTQSQKDFMSLHMYGQKKTHKEGTLAAVTKSSDNYSHHNGLGGYDKNQ